MLKSSYAERLNTLRSGCSQRERERERTLAHETSCLTHEASCLAHKIACLRATSDDVMSNITRKSHHVSNLVSLNSLQRYIFFSKYTSKDVFFANLETELVPCYMLSIFREKRQLKFGVGEVGVATEVDHLRMQIIIYIKTIILLRKANESSAVEQGYRKSILPHIYFNLIVKKLQIRIILTTVVSAKDSVGSALKPSLDTSMPVRLTY